MNKVPVLNSPIQVEDVDEDTSYQHVGHGNSNTVNVDGKMVKEMYRMMKTMQRKTNMLRKKSSR
jgi:hypothetical protein